MRDRIESFLLDLVSSPEFNPPEETNEEEIDEFADYRLSNEGHLHAFALWYEMGGPRQPLTPEQAVALDATVARDWRLLIKIVNRLKKDNEVVENAYNATGSGFSIPFGASGSGAGRNVDFLVRPVGPDHE